jgi:hypothetical protein
MKGGTVPLKVSTTDKGLSCCAVGLQGWLKHAKVCSAALLSIDMLLDGKTPR